MGVAGSGKTTIGVNLADALSWKFEDADSFHPSANVEKMSLGIALTDEDRRPWLQSLADSIRDHLKQNQSMVLACSALKDSYRQILHVDDQVYFVYLKGSFELFEKRLGARQGHFMKSQMLESQFETLEEPHGALIVDASESPTQIVEAILVGLKLV